MWPWRKKSKGYYRGPRSVSAIDWFEDYIDRKREMVLTCETYGEHSREYLINYLKSKGYNVVEKEKEMNEINLTNVKLKKDERGCYLRLKYIQETDNAINEIIIPKFRLPIRTDDLIIRNEGYHEGYLDTSIEANIGFGYFPLGEGVTEHSYGKKVCYSVKELEKKVHKMTVADIEKELGYKIEIVSEESEG